MSTDKTALLKVIELFLSQLLSILERYVAAYERSLSVAKADSGESQHSTGITIPKDDRDAAACSILQRMIAVNPDEKVSKIIGQVSTRMNLSARTIGRLPLFTLKINELREMRGKQPATVRPLRGFMQDDGTVVAIDH